MGFCPHRLASAPSCPSASALVWIAASLRLLVERPAQPGDGATSEELFREHLALLRELNSPGFEEKVAAAQGFAQEALLQVEEAAAAELNGKLLLLRISKTGGTSLRIRLQTALDPTRVVMVPEYAMSSWGLQPVDCTEGRRREFAFFVRDPIRRFLSGWIARYNWELPQHFVPGGADELLSFRRFPTPESLACGLSSGDAAVAAEAAWAMTRIGHIRHSISSFVGGMANLSKCPKDALAFVGRTEHFEEDFARLVETLEGRGALLVRPPLHAQQKVVPAHVMPERLRPLAELRAPCARRSLRRWYSEDYKIIRHLVALGHLPGDYLEEIQAVAD